MEVAGRGDWVSWGVRGAQWGQPGWYFMGVCEWVGIVNVKKIKGMFNYLFYWCGILIGHSSSQPHLTTHQTIWQCARQLKTSTLNINSHPGTQVKTNYHRSYFFYQSSWLTFLLNRCLAHVVNLANVDVMGHITKIAAVETSSAIWEYNPSLTDNQVLGGSLDVIAIIWTLAIKVTFLFYFWWPLGISISTTQIQASGQCIKVFNKLQIECGIMEPLKIPLHSNVRWGTAFLMLNRSHQLCEVSIFFYIIPSS